MAKNFATVNGYSLLSARICIPREGAWHGELAIEDDVALEKTLSIDINGVTFQATATRAPVVVEGTGMTTFAAGRNGLGTAIQPKMYNAVPLSIPLADILRTAGEVLSPYAQQSVLSTYLPSWIVVDGKCGAALNALVKLGAPEASWRYLLDGSLWVGIEDWAPIDVDFELLSDDAANDRAVFYMEHPSIIPGTTFQGRRVSYVEHSLRESKLRTTVWLERSDDT